MQYCITSKSNKAQGSAILHRWHQRACYPCDLSTTTIILKWGVLLALFVRFVNHQHATVGCTTCAIRAICHLPRTWSYDFYTDVRFESSVINFIFLMHLHPKVSWFLGAACDLSTTTIISKWGVLLALFVRFVNHQHATMGCTTCAIRAICHLPHTWSYDFYTDVRFESSVINFILLMHLYIPR